MTSELIDLEELRELADAATPGKWERVSARSIEADLGDGSWQVVIDEMNDGVGAGVIEPADAEFIAAARAAVPELLERLAATEAQLAEARSYKTLPSGLVWQDYYSPDDVLRIRQEIETQRAAALAKLAAVEVGINDALTRLNEVNDAALIDYETYSELHGLIAALGLPVGGDDVNC